MTYNFLQIPKPERVIKDRILVALSNLGGKQAIALAYEGESMCECKDESCRTYHGSRPQFELEQGSPNMDDHFSSHELPDTTGLWVWEGFIRYTSYGDDDDGDVHWQGEWLPATYADLVHFNINLPAITTKDI